MSRLWQFQGVALQSSVPWFAHVWTRGTRKFNLIRNYNCILKILIWMVLETCQCGPKCPKVYKASFCSMLIFNKGFQNIFYHNIIGLFWSTYIIQVISRYIFYLICNMDILYFHWLKLIDDCEGKGLDKFSQPLLIFVLTVCLIFTVISHLILFVVSVHTKVQIFYSCWYKLHSCNLMLPFFKVV